MTPRRPGHRALLLPAIARLMLGLAVLLWGTAYKVSLYPTPEQGRAPVPTAKLLSEKERPKATRRAVPADPAGPAITTHPIAVLPAAAASALLRAFAASALELPRPHLGWMDQRGLNYFFFLPPPASSFSLS
jgi:hypothetical protein